MKEILLTRGLVAIVDDDDFEELSIYKWNVLKGKYTFYAVRTSGARCILMHRQILGVSERTTLTDHRNGNGLDNRRENIRPCSITENNRNKRAYRNNKSGAKGVSWIESAKSWSVRITVDKNLIYIGSFKEKCDAMEAYNNAATMLHGKFASLNQT